MARIPGARHVLVPASPQSQGHYTSMRAAVWKSHLAEFLSGLKLLFARTLRHCSNTLPFQREESSIVDG